MKMFRNLLKPKLSFQPEAEEVIWQMNNVSREREWSGIPFYETRGQVSQPGMEIIVHTILPMQIGNPGETKFEDYQTSSHYLEFMRSRSKEIIRLKLKRGFIHSHADSPVFFSGSHGSDYGDMGELWENYGSFTDYLSVIVNNAGNCIAKVASPVTAEQVVVKGREGNIIEIDESFEYMLETDVVCKLGDPQGVVKLVKSVVDSDKPVIIKQGKWNQDSRLSPGQIWD